MNSKSLAISLVISIVTLTLILGLISLYFLFNSEGEKENDIRVVANPILPIDRPDDAGEIWIIEKVNQDLEASIEKIKADIDLDKFNRFRIGKSLGFKSNNDMTEKLFLNDSMFNLSDYSGNSYETVSRIEIELSSEDPEIPNLEGVVEIEVLEEYSDYFKNISSFDDYYNKIVTYKDYIEYFENISMQVLMELDFEIDGEPILITADLVLKDGHVYITLIDLNIDSLGLPAEDQVVIKLLTGKTIGASIEYFLLDDDEIRGAPEDFELFNGQNPTELINSLGSDLDELGFQIRPETELYIQDNGNAILEKLLNSFVDSNYLEDVRGIEPIAESNSVCEEVEIKTEQVARNIIILIESIQESFDLDATELLGGQNVYADGIELKTRICADNSSISGFGFTLKTRNNSIINSQIKNLDLFLKFDILRADSYKIVESKVMKPEIDINLDNLLNY